MADWRAADSVVFQAYSGHEVCVAISTHAVRDREETRLHQEKLASISSTIWVSL
jgi:hypothetical protein